VPSPEPAVRDDLGGRSSVRPGRHATRSVGAAASLTGWVRDRLPPWLRGGVALGTGHLTSIALLVAVAVGVTAWWVLRSDPEVRPVSATSPDPPAVAASPPNPLVSPSAAASPSADATIVVDVVGRVRRPGIATLPTGSRVVDALRAAGGARRGVSLTSLNLARVLVDGEQIAVGVRAAASGVAASAASAPGASTATPLVDINTADQTQLESLPGIGPVTAAAILKWRSDNGSFASVDQLLDVSGIGDVTLSRIAPFVTL
jgi:competence protein ComEA